MSVPVIHLVESLGRGGLEKVVATMATGLDPDRYRVAVWTLCSGGVVARQMREAGIAVEQAGCKPLLRPRQILALARKLRAEGTGVVHGHGYLPGVMARLSGWMARVPCRLAHRHTTDEGERLRHRFTEKFMARLGRTVCCSEAVRTRMVTEVGADPLRTEVIHNGVPLETFRPPIRRRRNNTPVIVTVASLRSLKGHGVLLYACSRLRERGHRFRMDLVGDGPNRQPLQKLAAELGLSKQVRFLGERDDIPELLADADLFVLPSTGREGLGIAALEAMASALPVVASRLGGLPEVVDHRRTGLLVPPGNAEALADAMERLLTDHRLADMMGDAGRTRVENCFSAEIMLSRMERLYERELEKGGTSGAGRKILFLSARGDSFGGGQAGLEMLAGSLDTRSYTPLVVVPEAGDMTARLSVRGVRTVLLPLSPWRSARPDRVVRTITRLRRLAAREKPAVVHVDNTRLALYACCLPRSIRRVWHLRDVRPDRLDRWLAGRFDSLVAVCGEVRRRRFPHLDGKRVRIVPNAVPRMEVTASRAQTRNALGIGQDIFMLLAAGRVEPQKGSEELVRALELIADKGLPVRAVVAGDGKTEDQERLREVAAELGVLSHLNLLGRRTDLAELMSAADLLVHPSWYEAAPRVVLEAMAHGLPVVASDVGGVPEILGDCGQLVPARSPESLAEAVVRLAGEPAALQMFSELGRRRYEALFTPERHLEAVASLYDDLLGTL
jgi:glycosyltransferase involved in cell wall biosynthesis